MSELKKVPTPKARVWVAFKRKTLPLIIWVAAVGLVIGLMDLRLSPINAVGLAEEQQVEITPLVDGEVRIMHGDLLEPVQKGRIVAVLDDQMLSLQIETNRLELKRLKSDYDQARLGLDLDRLLARMEFEQRFDQRKLDSLTTLRRLELDRDEAHIDYLDRRIDHEANKAELEYRNALAEAYSTASDVIASIEVEEALAERAALQVEVEQGAQAVEQSRKLYEAAETRLAQAQTEFDSLVDLGSEAQTELMMAFDPSVRLQPFSDAIAVQEAVVQELLQQKQQLVLHAPFDGIIASVDTTVGASVLRGSRVMEIHSAKVPYVRGWIDQSSGYQPEVGGKVEVITRSQPRRSLQGEIVKVGARIERFPLRLRPNPNLPQFGRTVIIAGFDEGLFPGEVLDLRFL